MPDVSDPMLAKEVAGRVLDAIMAHFIESGPWYEKTAYDVSYELYWHNAHAQMEHPSAQEVTLSALYAASDRKLRAIAQTCGRDNETYRIASYLQNLIEQAVANEAALAAFDHLQHIACGLEVER